MVVFFSGACGLGLLLARACGRVVSVVVVGAAVFGVIAGAAPASVAGSEGWTVQKSPDRGGSNGEDFLNGVAATSPSDAWAVGYYANGSAENHTLIEHWNGNAWRVQNSPSPGVSGFDVPSLNSVAATSRFNAWAVGYYHNAVTARTLVEHWNGKAWKVQKSPDPGGSSNDNHLQGVAATSATNAWVVGSYYNGTAYQTLVEHWNGKAWKVQKSPDPGGSSEHNFLQSVAATSATNAWAVGYYYNGTAYQTLVEHWNGKAWKVVKSPDPGGSSAYSQLYGVAATSATNAWAVGETGTATLVEHWRGKTWRVQKSPSPDTYFGSQLYKVAATSPTNAWAVGYWASSGGYLTLVEHWNGNAWRVQKSPTPGGPSGLDQLHDVAATSPTNAWAVGYYCSNGCDDQTLVEHRG